MRNPPMASIASVSLIFLAFTSIINFTNAQICYPTGNFTTNSTYARNRDIVLSSLASNVTANDRFFTTTVGQGQDQVYGLVLCRRDSTLQACSSCVNSAVQGLKDTCQSQKEARVWSGDPICLVRYANRSFFGILELSSQSPDDWGYNVNNITSNMEQFNQVWTSLTDRLVSEASMGTSKLKYASGEANFTVSQNIYGVMTCTPDLSQSNCSTCLQTVVSQYKNCCLGHQGGYSQNPNCHFRWDLYPFFVPVADTPATVSPPNPINGKKGVDSRTVVIIVVPAIIFVGLLAACFALYYQRKTKLEIENEEEKSDTECLQFSFATIKLATNNFSGKNKLGQGGFGAVYKGVLPNRQIIAVKRLSINSRQGEAEFKNEVIFVARLQHRNLVRLLGFCLEGKERLLIYEFLPNSSLDRFIFDASKRELVEWDMRRQIIMGVARGVLYLHQDSQLRIVHRDLKASNILLDENMNPKISDFGMAKLVGIDQTEDTASRIVGTFGYMAPEYAMRGHFSVKSDVFSFGVLVLEMISGEKINSFHGGEEDEDLLTFAWSNWNKGTAWNLIDPALLRTGSTEDMIGIMHIALLCVQQNVANRPTMASVILMLSSSSLTLPSPTRPAFFLHSTMGQETLSFTRKTSESTVSLQSKSSPLSNSVNEVSITEIKPR